MLKFSANVSTLFTELEFPDRFAAAAKAGFPAVECQFPYAYDKREIAEWLKEQRLILVLHNMPCGDRQAGDRGIACHPDRMEEFRESVSQAIEYATVLGCPTLNCPAGRAPAGWESAEVRRALVDNLRFAAAETQRAGIRLLVEPLNTFDTPGFAIHGTRQAADLIGEVGSDNLRIQYDIYHMQRMEGELAETLRRYLPLIGHIQLADNPGRREPGTGEINFPWLLRHIDCIGYEGWIGCEYKPAGPTEDSLSWLRALS